jgi:hypothetical protein
MTTLRTWLAVAWGLPPALLPPALLPAAVLPVPDGHPTIQAALDAAAAGDTVLVARGHYHERLVMPPRDICLISDILVTGDTLALEETIIDGDLQGSTITINTSPIYDYSIVGFTISGGLGGFRIGGGIHIVEAGNVVLKHLKFDGNTSVFSGAGVLASAPMNISLEFMKIGSNETSGTIISVYSLGKTYFRGLSVRSPCPHNVLSAHAADTLIVREILIANQNRAPSLVLGTTGQHNNGHTDVRDITLRNNTFSTGTVMRVGSTSRIKARNIWWTDNRQTGHSFPYASVTGVYLDALSDVDADSLYFLRNRTSIGQAAGGIVSGFGMAHVKHLVVRDCVVGDSSYVNTQVTNSNALFYTNPGIVTHSEFSNNVYINAPNPENPLEDWRGASLMTMHPSWLLDSCRFINNHVIELSDYAAIGLPMSGKEGRLVAVSPSTLRNFRISNCVFEGNRNSNMAPECHWTWNVIYGAATNIGSMIKFYLEPYLVNTNYRMENCLFRDNDEGGIDIRGNDFTMRNVALINGSRLGVRASVRTIRMDNVLIDGVRAVDPIPLESEQMALLIWSDDSSHVTNTTIMNCDTPYLVQPGYRTQLGVERGRVVFTNCLFWDNTFGAMEADPRGFGPMDDGQPLPGIYRHSLLPEPRLLQDQCLVAVDPLFDEVLGAPFLSAESPCVDAGHPASAYEDPEDPDNPGFALWPSQGTLRNDMGFTGGPHAALYDTTWTHLPTWEPKVRPQVFSLGAPWPNPFNPVTHIPLTLLRPMPVRLVVHNLLGQQVAVLVDGILPAGTHHLPFQAGRLASGVYLVTLEAAGRAQTRTVTLLR